MKHREVVEGSTGDVRVLMGRDPRRSCFAEASNLDRTHSLNVYRHYPQARFSANAQCLCVFKDLVLAEGEA